MKANQIDYDELERLLRQWRSLACEETYDFVGMFHLFRACLLNLMDNSSDDDWSSVYELMNAEELAFLEQLIKKARTGSE